MSGRTGFVARVKEANAPRPPEGSIPLRAACVAAVAVSLGAAASEGEIAWRTAALVALLVAVGTTFSHRTRHRSHGWVKVLVAVSALAVTGDFMNRLYGAAGTGITGAEGPLVFLLGSILVVHSFHVPARRDLLFALAGSAAMIAVAAAAAVDMSFARYALAWAASTFWALIECGAATAGVRPKARQVAGAAATAAAVGLVAFLLLPAPAAKVSLDFRSDPGSAGAVPTPGQLAGDGSSPTELSRPGSASGPTRVGGYLGFAGDLNTAVRGDLGHQVVMQVRASIPTFWVGETYDRWDGRSWSTSPGLRKSATLPGGSPFTVPGGPTTFSPPTVTDLQTFYIEGYTADLAFHADQADQVWISAPYLRAGLDGSLVSPRAMGKGAIYTVESSVARPTAAQLIQAGTDPQFPASVADPYMSLPQDYSAVRQLVSAVTAGASGEYGDVEALIAWIGAHTTYSTDIPPLPAGVDAVDNFLFGSRVGYCEQISTALAVMLRTMGVPAREAVGYVPGPYNPVTDVYEVQADDAHAWVQVWFPGFGWVSFDPTAVVPEANPAPGMVALRDAGRFIAHLPWSDLGRVAAGAVVCVGAVFGLRRRRVAARITPAQLAVARMEKIGGRAGRPRRPAETVTEYAAALAGSWPEVAAAIDASTYGGIEVGRAEFDRLLAGATARLSG